MRHAYIECGSGLEYRLMRTNRLIAPLTAAVVLLLAGQAARADLLITVDKSAQRMTVVQNGRQLYQWPVSTGGRGYDTPSGMFKPFRMEIDHTSDEWDNAPMPYSIFFTQTGDAIHGTYEARHLGRPVSHGCVRLSVQHAATLWSLVKREKMANTKVVLTGAIRDAGPPPVARAPSGRSVAHARPTPLYADDPRYGTPPQYQPRGDYYGPPQYQAREDYYGQPQYPRPYNDRPPPIFPFFLFGR
jgi:hypothetical protein